jgi:hypothetical protein
MGVPSKSFIILFVLLPQLIPQRLLQIQQCGRQHLPLQMVCTCTCIHNYTCTVLSRMFAYTHNDTQKLQKRWVCLLTIIINNHMLQKLILSCSHKLKRVNDIIIMQVQGHAWQQACWYAPAFLSPIILFFSA